MLCLMKLLMSLTCASADLSKWSWDAPDGIPVAPRRQLNGNYWVMMDEDVVHAISSHYIGTIEAKQIFREFALNDKVWRGAQAVSHEDRERYRDFTGQEPPTASASER